MNRLYQAAGTSKQAFHQYMNRQLHLLEEQGQLLPVIAQLREDHPRMSVRLMYELIHPRQMGRDRFEQFCFAAGFKLRRKRSYARTTDSSGVIRFENLVVGLELTGVNQVWVSDITYYRIGDRFYFLTFIMDAYSRFIVGNVVSRSLRTEETTLPALQNGLRLRCPREGLILHSDGGGQYYSSAFLTLTRNHGIGNSMAESVYENPHAERINGTIKNDYLVHYAPANYAQLVKMTAKAVEMYNLWRPHRSLGKLSPAAFEQLSTQTAKKEESTKEEKTCGNMENSTEFPTFPQANNNKNYKFVHP